MKDAIITKAAESLFLEVTCLKRGSSGCSRLGADVADSVIPAREA
jgi:hypothetical protein